MQWAIILNGPLRGVCVGGCVCVGGGGVEW